MKKNSLAYYAQLIEQTNRELLELKKDVGEIKQPGKWTDKQILGHLCDSAINNYYRFLHLQSSPGNFIVEKYEQEMWVDRGDYQNRDWKEIVEFWHLLNKSILIVLIKSFEKNKTVEVLINAEKFDFEFLVQDYYDHLKHHIQQILSTEKPVR